MDVLQDDPVAFAGGRVHGSLGYNLLTLAQGYVVEVLAHLGVAHLFTQGLNIFQWVDSRRQNKEDGRGRA